MKYYAGIGSRETPIEIKYIIYEIVDILNTKSYVLRSGGAPGADKFFEEKASQKEIFLPWKGFEGNESNLYLINEEAHEIARKYHPAYYKLSHPAKLFMARNSYQVLGYDLKTPSEFIICWTKNGKEVGGTSQAIRIAKDKNIPVYNLFNQQEELYEFLKTI